MHITESETHIYLDILPHIESLKEGQALGLVDLQIIWMIKAKLSPSFCYAFPKSTWFLASLLLLR